MNHVMRENPSWVTVRAQKQRSSCKQRNPCRI